MSYVDNRLVMQYKESPKVTALLKAFIDAPTDELELVFADLLQRLNIDAMEGANLDRIGEIVGLARPQSLGAEADYYETVFTYSSDGSVEEDLGLGYGFGEYENPEPFPPMSDSEYRRFLKAKIIKNNSNKTLLDCEKAAATIFVGDFEVEETVGVSVTFKSQQPALPAFVETLKAVVPVAGGIKIEYEVMT